jgi:arginyl-tRNA synthetase
MGKTKMRDYKSEIATELAKITSIEADRIYSLIEIPPQKEMGDYAFPCFSLAKTMRKSPAVIASEISESLKGKLAFIQNIDANSGYLNLFVRPQAFIYEVTTQTIQDDSMAGSSKAGEGKTVLVEFSSPNIAKPFHVGHAFTTILGNALNNIYRHLGYNTVKLNHLGDYGTQFGKLISAYKRWGDEAALLEHPIKELLRIYVKFHDEAKQDAALDDEARVYFKNLENKSAEEVALWEKFRTLSLLEFNEIYERLGVTFDDLNGESFYSDKIPEVVSMLKEKNILVESDGAQVVMLDEFGLPPCIVLKSDGTTIYASRDIAAVLYRIRTYDFFKNIYVVGSPQALHFKQVFAVVKKMGIDRADDCIHVGFGLVKFADVKFSTREGNIILLEDLLNECVAKTFEIIKANQEERKTDMSDEEMAIAAERIGIGAVIYTFCKNSRERDIVFSWDEMLDFEGDSAPYVMYSYARCQSIVRKAAEKGIVIDEIPLEQFDSIETEEEFTLAKLIYGLKDSIENSASSNEPFILVRQINSIARAFNKFYNNSPILNNPDEKIMKARIAICLSTSVAIKTGLELLGIKTVERM